MQEDKFSPIDLKRINRFKKILSEMTEPMSYWDVALRINKCSRDTARLDMVELMNIGCVARHAVRIPNGKMLHMYTVLKQELDLSTYRPMKDKFKASLNETRVRKESTISGGTIIRLTETTHWHREPKKSPKVHIGSTLSDAYMGV